MISHSSKLLYVKSSVYELHFNSSYIFKPAPNNNKFSALQRKVTYLSHGIHFDKSCM